MHSSISRSSSLFLAYQFSSTVVILLMSCDISSLCIMLSSNGHAKDGLKNSVFDFLGTGLTRELSASSVELKP